MNVIMEHLMGLHNMTDKVIAMDFLISAKSGVRNYALAVTEAATPEIKNVLIKHLEEAMDTLEKIQNYTVQRGLYHPYDVNEQITLVRQNIQTAIDIPS